MRIFLTHIVPKDKIIECGVSMACCNFSYNLISGHGFDKIYSILPSFVNRQHNFNTDGNIEILYSSVRNSLLYKIAPLVENIILFKKIKKNTSLWLYNITVLNVLLFTLLKLFKPSVKIYIIVLDFTPNFINSFCFLKYIKASNGLICLANSSLFKNKNKLCLPGVVPTEVPEYPKVTSVNKSFLISGVLSDNIAMLPMLLDAFSRMPDLTLHITGKIQDNEIFKSYLEKYQNIFYHGMVEYNEYLNILHNTTFLLSTRNPMSSENQCNFPSKIIEALLHNRIIISTIRYAQLNGIEYFYVPSDTEGFINSLQCIVNKPHDDLLVYANQASKVKQRFNVKVWNDAMNTIEKTV